MVAIFFGFGGTLIILRPGLESFEAGSLAVLLASIGLAASLVFTKLLSKTETPLSIVFYMTGIQALVGLLPGLIVWVTPNIGDFIWIGAIAIVGLTSHFCLAKALTYADATVIIPFDFLRLPLAAVVGFFLYHEELEFAVLAGGAFIAQNPFLENIIIRNNTSDNPGSGLVYLMDCTPLVFSDINRISIYNNGYNDDRIIGNDISVSYTHLTLPTNREV